jgi:hypothetical protein
MHSSPNCAPADSVQMSVRDLIQSDMRGRDLNRRRSRWAGGTRLSNGCVTLFCGTDDHAGCLGADFSAALAGMMSALEAQSEYVGRADTKQQHALLLLADALSSSLTLRASQPGTVRHITPRATRLKLTRQFFHFVHSDMPVNVVRTEIQFHVYVLARNAQQNVRT